MFFAGMAETAIVIANAIAKHTANTQHIDHISSDSGRSVFVAVGVFVWSLSAAATCIVKTAGAGAIMPCASTLTSGSTTAHAHRARMSETAKKHRETPKRHFGKAQKNHLELIVQTVVALNLS